MITRFGASVARTSIKAAGFAWGRFSRRTPNAVTVFTLHRASWRERGEIYARPDVIASWLQAISTRYEVIDPDDFPQWWDGSAKTGSRSAALVTIDDAFDDCYSEIWPLLRSLKLHALLFVPTAFIESPDRLPVSYSAPAGTHRPCSWAQINEMADSGWVRLGAHSHDHDVVTTQAPDQLHADCERHTEIFEKQGLAKPMHYAYPRGVISMSAAQVLQQHYAFGFAGSPHQSLPGDLAPMAIPRLPLRGSDQVWAGQLKVRGWASEEERLVELAKKSVHSMRRLQAGLSN